jgi:2',3'-cyclic-nucleotide 2'-phosphodiesterase
MTSGNHIWDKKEIIAAIDQYPALIRPLNYPASQPGKGSHIGRGKDTRTPVATLNLSGRVFMNGSIDDPFTLGMKEVERLRKEAAVIIVDAHCEATSEKQALGHWFDGHVSAVVGTHTHVPTCDHRILPKGTAFVTDLGMTGPYDSVIGMEKENILQRFVHGISNRFEPAKLDARFAAAVVTVDPNSGKAKKIDRMLLTEANLDGL